MELVKENIVTVTAENFTQEVLQCSEPVLVNFYAAWDQPCRMQQPALDYIADNYPQIKVCKLDVEEYPEVAQKYGIIMVPTTIAFKGGKKIKRASGLRLKQVLLKMVLE